MRVALVIVFWAALNVAGVGCHGAKAPPASPGIDVTWSAYSGSAVGSPTTQPVDSSVGWAVHTTLLTITKDPGQVLSPLSARGRLFAQPALGDPVMANPQLTRDVRFGNDAAALAYFESLLAKPPISANALAESKGVLAAGVTLAIRAQKADQQIEIRMHRRADERLELLVAMQGMVAPSGESVQPARLARESVLIDPFPMDVGNPIIVLIPLKLEGSTTQASLARFDLSLQSSDESFTQAMKNTRGMLDRSASDVAAIPSRLPTRSDAWSGYEFALRRTDESKLRRSSLNFVAAQTGSLIAHDLIVVADDATLGEYTELLLRSMAQSTLPHEPELLGWLMDRVALALCAERAAAGPISTDISSVLTIHAGEVGRNPASLSDLIAGVGSREDLATRLTVENMIYLEDSSPASRVRAFDFLAARGLAPPDYDPLGALPQRRAALERASAPTSAPTTAPATAPTSPGAEQ